MSNELFNKSSGDLDGSDETSSTESRSRGADTVYQLINTTDVDVTFKLEGTRREDESNFNDAYELESNTVTSSEDVGAMSLNSTEFERLRVSMSFSSNPSSGDVQVFHMAAI